MSKINLGNDQLIVHAKNEQEARFIVGKELARFDKIKYFMSELVTENGKVWQNFMSNVSDERLSIHFNDATSLIYDEDGLSRGEVRQQRNEDNTPKTDRDGNYLYQLAYRYPDIEGHNADFRLAHEMGHLMLNPSNPNRQKYNSVTNTRQVAGLIRVPKGKENKPNAMYGTKMQENAINLLAQLAIRGKNSADDIITGKIDLSEFNLYRKCDELVNLLVVSMRNDFDKEISFEQLMAKKIDSVIKHSDGTQEPSNTFLYGMLNDSCIIEIEFDKYMGKGAWRQLDEAITQLHTPEMSQEKFKTIFEAAQGLIIEFANARIQDKYKEAVERDGESNVPGIENKMQMIKDMTRGQNSHDIESDGHQGPSGDTLSLKQKVAQFLRKHNIFMDLTFVENFVNKQLNVFSTKESSANIAKRRLKSDLENRLSNNGEFKNMPPLPRMPDSDGVTKMPNKMKLKPEGR